MPSVTPSLVVTSLSHLTRNSPTMQINDDNQQGLVPEGRLQEQDLATEKLRLEVASMRSRTPSWLRDSQPFLLLIATAAISGTLVPYVTRQWQLKEKELEIKSELVTSMNRAISSFEREIQAFEVRKVQSGNKKFEPLNEAYAEWQVQSSELSGKIRAYFPQAAPDWNAHVKVIDELYALTGTNVPELRKTRVDALKAYVKDASIDWDALADTGETWSSVEDARPFERAWFALRDKLSETKDRIVSKILVTMIAIR